MSVRNLDDTVKEQLHLRSNDRGGPRADLFTALTERFGRLGGVVIDLPERNTRPRAAVLRE